MPQGTWLGGIQPGSGLGGNLYGYGADPTMVQQGLSREQMGLEKQLAGNQLDWQKQKFNTILPLLTGGLNAARGGIPGANIPTPQITAGPVYNPQQMQAQKNLIGSQAQGDIGTQQKQIAQSSAGRGFGSNSPLQQALSTEAAGMGRAGERQAQTQAGLTMAAQNAQQRLASQQAAAQAQLGAAQIGVEAQRPWWQLQSSLIGALAGLA
jgi:hypothetical protein